MWGCVSVRVKAYIGVCVCVLAKARECLACETTSCESCITTAIDHSERDSLTDAMQTLVNFSQ